MQNIILISIAVFCFWTSGFAQTTFRISSGNLKINGNYNLVLNNTQFVNDGSFDAGTGTVVITGTSTDAQSAIAGTNSITFYNLQINKTTNGSQLQRAIQVDNELQMTMGNLDLNGNNCTLGSANGIIMSESETSRVTGTAGGFITKTVNLNAPSNVNPGNLGSVLSSTENIGALTIRRGHVPQTLGGNSGIARFFEFDHANDADLMINATFQYFDAELNGNTEAALDFWRQDNNSFWFNPQKSSASTMLNTVDVSNINLLTKWTLGPSAPKVSAKIFLEGNYSPTNGNMSDILRSSSLIPSATPYTSPNYNFGSGTGGESINAFLFTPATTDAVVDWVFVALRSTAAGNPIVSARCALLQRDGDIVDLDGRSPVSFPGAGNGSYYVSIRHRNHLGIRSLNTLSLTATSIAIDFTTTNSIALGTSNALKRMTDGTYVLFSGDFNVDGQIQIGGDLDGILPTLGQAGYLNGDIDLNGQVQNTEAQNILVPNLGRGAQYSY